MREGGREGVEVDEGDRGGVGIEGERGGEFGGGDELGALEAAVEGAGPAVEGAGVGGEGEFAEAGAGVVEVEQRPGACGEVGEGVGGAEARGFGVGLDDFAPEGVFLRAVEENAGFGAGEQALVPLGGEPGFEWEDVGGVQRVWPADCCSRSCARRMARAARWVGVMA